MSSVPVDSRATRLCPVCGARQSATVCASDGHATLYLDAPPSDPHRLQPGDIVGGRYRLQRVLGRGAFGDVFFAHHLTTGQEVAVKVLDGAGRDLDGVLRLMREARITARLKSPYTVRVFDAGQQEDGVVYLAMAYLRGRTLAAELAERARAGQPADATTVLTWAAQVLESLVEAHANGLVHRDLKPDNLFLEDHSGGQMAQIRVLDFGIAREVGRSTQGHVLAGTPRYVSPEQVRTGALDGRSDLYSLGVVLFEMLAGRPPFDGADVFQLLYQHVNDTPPDLQALARTTMPAGTAAFVAQLLAKDPADRPQSAQTALACVQALLGQPERNSPPDPKTGGAQDTGRQAVVRSSGRAVVVVASLAMSCAVAVGLWWWRPDTTAAVPVPKLATIEDTGAAAAGPGPAAQPLAAEVTSLVVPASTPPGADLPGRAAEAATATTAPAVVDQDRGGRKSGGGRGAPRPGGGRPIRLPPPSTPKGGGIDDPL